MLGNRSRSSLVDCVDTLVNYEYFGSGYRGDGTHAGDYHGEGWLKNFTGDHFAHILHTEAKLSNMKVDLTLAAKRGVGFIYITDSAYSELHPNPYDRLPTFWKEETLEVSAERKRH